MKNPVTTGIEIYPGPLQQMAKDLGLKSYQAIKKWEKSFRIDGKQGRVPESRIEDFSRVTGLSPHEIRPDLAELFEESV
jgi:hypothetical protein